MWWPYMIHFRTKRTVVILILILFIIYCWYHLFDTNNLLLLNSLRSSSYKLSSINFKHLVIACILAAQHGGVEVKKARKLTDLMIHVKGKTREGIDDIITIGDKKSNTVMVNSLLYTIPGIKIISEESISSPKQQENEMIELLDIEKHLKNPDYATIPDNIELNIDDLTIWIDPLDATKEYGEGLTKYVTTMVCVARHNEPLIGVIHFPFEESKTYWATKFGVDKKLLNQMKSPSDNFNNNNNSSIDANSIRIIISRSHKGDVEKWIKDRQQLYNDNSKNNKINNIDNRIFEKNLTFIEAAGSGYKTLQLINGQADIYIHKTYIKKWDICAPNVLIKYLSSSYNMNGTLTTLNGHSIDYDFYSNLLIKDGIFATLNSQLVKWRDILN